MIFIFLMHMLLKMNISWLLFLTKELANYLFYFFVLNAPPHMIILRQGQGSQRD